MKINIIDDLPDLDDRVLDEEIHILLPLVGILLPEFVGEVQEEETQKGANNASRALRESVNSAAS